MIIHPIKILSEGCVLGNIKNSFSNTYSYEKGGIKEEKTKLNNAIANALAELEEIKISNPNMSNYIEIQELMIKDKILYNHIIENIDNGLSTIDSLEAAINIFIKPLNDSDNQYLKERIIDIEDIKERIFRCLTKTTKDKIKDKYIICVDKILPSQLINNRDTILGIIAKTGGYTSHASIMCRSWDIPYVVCDYDFVDNSVVIIDTASNRIIVNPSKVEINKYNSFDHNKIKKAVEHSEDYLFLANVSNNEDLLKAIEYEFDGIGLYRTECIFMNSNQALSFEQQYKIYSEAVNLCKGKPINFRTFDIGDDKQLSYLKSYKKAIDNYINNPTIFEEQVKAILKSNKYDNIRIMFPMIDNHEEFQYLKNWVLKIKNENNYLLPKIGVTIETKSSFENYQDFINADFIAIGTNDLLSQLYNIDREKEFEIEDIISDFITKLIPVIEFTNKNNICLSICGEIAAIKDIAIKLYQIGFKNLSVSPSMINVLNSSYLEHKNDN